MINLKKAFKKKNWSSSSFITNQLLDLKNKQLCCLNEIQTNPLDQQLNAFLKAINENLDLLNSSWNSWISQRAKSKCLSNGENDLGFLYAHIRARKNHNVLKEIDSPLGLCSTHSDISVSLINHFSNLFNATKSPSADSFTIPTGNLVSSQQAQDLIAPFSDEEIKLAVFAGHSSLTPGPDGFTFEFYKSSWHIIGNLVCKAVKSFYFTNYLPRGVKTTAIALIPKGPHASNISDYRPISLCNVLYKIVAKVLASRLKKVLPTLIHDSQVGFIYKRCSTDNIMMAAEVLRDFNNSSKLLCAKLDIKKAFDSVSRDFLINRMRQKAFPEKFIQWIKSCISDVFFSVCLNGSLEGHFKSSSGLRQGCPLSPLLLCIVMDVLSHILTSDNGFKGICLNGISFNHLMYADDLLVFGQASPNNVNILRQSMDTFSAASGLYINNHKSSIIFLSS